LGTSSEFPHEVNNISPWVGQGDITLGHEEEVASSPCHEVCDDLGVSTPKCNEALALDDPLLGTDIIQEVHITDDQSSAYDIRECSFVEPILDLGSNTYGVALQHDVDDCSYKSHHLIGQLKVSECMIVEAMRHFDATHAMVAKCCWRTMVVLRKRYEEP